MLYDGKGRVVAWIYKVGRGTDVQQGGRGRLEGLL